MGFLNENDSLAYFAILGKLSSGLSFTVSLFKTLSCLSLLADFFRGQGKSYLAIHVLVGLTLPVLRERGWYDPPNVS